MDQPVGFIEFHKVEKPEPRSTEVSIENSERIRLLIKAAQARRNEDERIKDFTEAQLFMGGA